MELLDSRSKVILSWLLQSDRYITARELGEKLNITARMVRYKIDELKPWVNSLDAEIEKKHGKGYRIVCSSTKRKELLESLKDSKHQPLLMNPSERRCTILLNAFVSTEPLLVKQLERKLNVSRSTILRDFDEISQWLNKRELTLVRKPNFGFQVSGTELNLRLGVVDLLINLVESQDFAELFSRKQHQYSQLSKGNSVLAQELFAFIETLNLVDNAQIVRTFSTEQGIRFSDYAYNKIVLYLSIMVTRWKKGCADTEPVANAATLEENKECYFATLLLDSIQQKFKLALPHCETSNLTIQLMQANIIVDSAVAVNIQNKPGYAVDIPVLAKEFIKAVSLRLHPSLQTNDRLLELLVSHLTRLTHKTESQVSINNPLIAEIQEKIPETFKVAKAYSPMLETGLGIIIPNDEIGYIAVYLESALQKLQLLDEPIKLLVVSTADAATSLLFYSRIRAEFPDLIVAGKISLQEFPEWIKKNRTHLIVSNTHVDGGQTPSVKVGNFVNQEDVARIRETIEKQVKSNIVQESLVELGRQPTLKDVLPKENIRLSVRTIDWKDAVSKAVNILVNSGAVEPRFIKAVIEQHEENGSYMVIAPGIALLHARPSDGARSVAFSLCRLTPPVSFNHPHNDPVDIVIAFSAVNPHSHVRALNEIVRLLEEPEFLQQVRKAKFPNEIINFVKTFIPKTN